MALDTSTNTNTSTATYNPLTNQMISGAPPVPTPPVTPKPAPIFPATSTGQGTPVPSTTGVTGQAVPTPGKDVFGNPVADTGITNLRQGGGTYQGADGKTYYNYDNTPVGNPPDTTTTGTPSDQLRSTQTEYQNVANNVYNTINNITNGTIPLTPGEQAQVDGLKQQFQTMIDQQKLQNAGASGLANTRGYQLGAAEYDPTFQTNIVASVVTAGLNKVNDLNVKMASAVATLTDSLKNNDIANIKTAYDIYQTAAKDRIATLQKTVDDANKAIVDARDFAAKQAQQTIDNNLNSDKLTLQQKQDAIDNAFKQGQLTETERHNKATELLASGAGGGAGGNSNLPQVNMTAQNRPDPIAQQNYLASLPGGINGDLATLIKGVADYKLNLNVSPQKNYRGTAGLTQAQLGSYVLQYDPTFSESQFANRQAYMKSLQSGPIYNGVVAGNKAINHLVAFTDSISKLPNTFSDTINTVQNNMTLNQGIKQTIATAKVEGLGVGEELAKFFKGTGTVDVTSINEWAKNLSVNASPAEQRGLIQGAITLLAGQLDVVNQGYINTMGKAPEGAILQPATIQKLSVLKNKGYQVDISGVNYTDVNAYMKYGGGSQDALNKARQMLINANDPNNPPTAENILELAQIQ